MYKSSLYQKQDKKNYHSGKEMNFLSPPINSKIKPKQFLNSNMPKFKPVNLYSTYLSPSQNEKNFSVKNINSPDDKLNQDLLNKFSNYQKNLNGKMLQSPNTTNSDLLTVASLNTQQSNESLLSNNTNTSTYIPTTFQPMINNYTVCQFPGHRYNYSMANYPQMNYFYPTNNNPFLNGNYSNMNMKYKNRQSVIMTNKTKKNNQNTISNTNNNKFKKNTGTNYIKNKNNANNNTSNNNSNSNEDKIDVSNFNSNNSIKSGSGSEKSNSNSDSIKTSSNNNQNSTDSVNGKSEKKSKNSNNSGINMGSSNGIPRKKYYNKFNSPKENNTTNENTVILTLKIKVAPNDFRTFNLKKYDDLFISLEKFFDLNKIQQDLVKPIVTKIFEALNKIFWLLNNKIGIYDQEYLNSLFKLWKKNNEQIPKSNDDKEESKSNNSSSNDNNGRNKKNKENSDKSTISSSDSSDGNGNKKHKKIMSNSFQNLDNSSEDAKEDTVNSI